MRREWTLAALLLVIPALALGQFNDALGKIGEGEPAPVDAPPGGILNGIAPDGSEHPQRVGTPDADLQVVVMPEAGEAMVGGPFRVHVRVVGDPARVSAEARIRIDAKLRRADGTAAPASDVAIASAWVPAAGTESRRDCEAAAGGDRVCRFGDIAAGGDGRASAELAISPSAQPGSLVLTVTLRVGEGEKAPVVTTIPLVPMRALTEAGLTVEVASDSDVGAVQLDFEHTVIVRNESRSEEATRVELEIRQRAVVQRDGAFARLTEDGMDVGFRGNDCVREPESYRCVFASIPAGGEVRVALHVRILKDLPAQRRGRVETQARVRSAERDPEPENNFGKSVTTIVSRKPQLAFLRRVDDGGRTRYEPRALVASGETFEVGARFMHLLVEPEAEDLPVHLAVNGSETATVTLRRSPLGNERTFRSGPLRLLPPGAKAADGERAIHAASGDELRASLDRAAASARVYGN